MNVHHSASALTGEVGDGWLVNYTENAAKRDALRALLFSSIVFILVWFLMWFLFSSNQIHQMILSGVIYFVAAMVAFLTVLAANRFFNPSAVRLFDGSLTLRFRSGRMMDIPMRNLQSIEIRRRRFNRETMHVKISWFDSNNHRRRRHMWLLATEGLARFIQENVTPRISGEKDSDKAGE